MSTSATDFSSKTSAAADHLETLSQDIGERFGAQISKLSGISKDYARTGRDYVQENPLKGILLSAVAGAAFGSLLTLALRRR